MLTRHARHPATVRLFNPLITEHEQVIVFLGPMYTDQTAKTALSEWLLMDFDVFPFGESIPVFDNCRNWRWYEYLFLFYVTSSSIRVEIPESVRC